MAPPTSPNRRFFASIFAAATLFDGSFYIVLSVIPLRAIELDASVLQLGLLPVLGSGTYVVAALVMGRLADRLPRMRLARIGVILRTALVLGVMSARTPEHLLAWMPLLGLANGFYWPGMQAALGSVAEGRRLGRVLGGFNVAWSGGKMVGFLLGGTLVQASGHHLPLVISAIAGAVPFVILPWRDLSRQSAREGANQGTLPGSADHRSATSAPPMNSAEQAAMWRRVGWLANFVLFGLGSTLNFHYPKWLDTIGLGGGSVFGIYLGVVYLAQTVVFVICGTWSGWHYRLRPIVVTQGIAAIAVLALVWLRSPWLIWATAPAVGLGLGLSYSSSIFYSLEGTKGKGRSSGIHEALLGTGSFLLPFVAGLLVEWTDLLAVPYWMLAALLGAAILAETAIIRAGTARRRTHA